jgi:hydrogenase maturation factor
MCLALPARITQLHERLDGHRRARRHPPEDQHLARSTTSAVEDFVVVHVGYALSASTSRGGALFDTLALLGSHSPVECTP